MREGVNIFITSDVWFNRPIGDFSYMTNEEYNDMIIDNWNEIVGKYDIVYVLGGFCIGDCYDIVLKLNGKIHFLNSVFGSCDSSFLSSIKDAVENSVNKELSKRIFFEKEQILAIPREDCILSYFPLNDWAGKSTDTMCFHGYTDKHNLNENNISCRMDMWENAPVNIREIKNNFVKFKKILSK